MRTVGSGPYVDRVVLWNPEDTTVVSKGVVKRRCRQRNRKEMMICSHIAIQRKVRREASLIMHGERMDLVAELTPDALHHMAR